MILRDKMFVVAGNLDDSIKRQTSLYDIRLFKSFVDFESYVNNIPVVLDTIVITSDELAFTATNMTRLKNILDSPFLKITGHILYLVDFTYDVDVINKFLQDRELNNWVVYQGNLSVRFITDIVTGDARQTEEVQTELVTYRVRASEYYKKMSAEQGSTEDDDNKYFADEELFDDVAKEEEAEDINPASDDILSVNYVVGDTVERTVMAFLIAQYRALTGKTIILEKDWEYHTLTNMVLASGIKCHLALVEDLMRDSTSTLNAIRRSKEKLIVVGTKERKKFNYNFIMDLLESNLRESIYFMVRECDFAETPYGRYYTVTMPNTSPEILRACNQLKYLPDKEKVTFVGVQACNLGPVNVTSKEMGAILSVVLEQNGLAAKVVKIEGILLKGDEVVYDILGILNRGNKGQA